MMRHPQSGITEQPYFDRHPTVVDRPTGGGTLSGLWLWAKVVAIVKAPATPTSSPEPAHTPTRRCEVTKARTPIGNREMAAVTRGAAHGGFDIRRQPGAGRADDVGDLTGVPNTVVQVANRTSDTLRAIREKPVEVERQRQVAGVTLAVTLVHLRGGTWRAVQTPEQTDHVAP